jgi:hypothetical protein
MATNDLRRTDLRTNVRINPFWIVSAEFGALDTNDDAVLFGFPLVGGDYFVHEVLVVVGTNFTEADGVTGIGYGTITAAGVLTDTDDTRFMVAAEITANSAATYPGGAIAMDADGVITGSDWAIAKAEGTIGNLIIAGADYDSLPVIYAPIKTGQSAGVARLHMFVSRLQ